MSDGLPYSVQMQRLETSVIKWVLNDLISRADIAINNSAGETDMVLETGTVMGAQAAGTPGAAVANAGNTGNGTVGTVSPEVGIQVGAYNVIFVAATEFNVYGPNGAFIGFGKTGTAFNAGGVSFTITAGGAAFVAGDGFSIAIPAGAGTYVPLNATATDGSAVPAAILYARAFIAAGTSDDGAAVTRFAAVIPDTLIWPSGYTATQIAAALAQLAQLNIFTVSRV